MNNTTINVRIDSATKKEANKIFKNLGLDTSTAIKMLLRRAVDTQSIPFEVRTENGFTAEWEKKMLSEIDGAVKEAGKYNFKKGKEVHNHILCR